ncbi:MAG: hypothetical protein N2747_01270 [Chitinophagaceae bacterium]|nr:hypothetical protein [Chitinophagaceae bacterium]
MKNTVLQNSVQLNDEVVTKLKKEKEAKETLVSEKKPERVKRLTVVDMWNIHKNGRSASALIRRWNLN